MVKSLAWTVVLCLAVALGASEALSRGGAQGPAPGGEELAITISPATFNLATHDAAVTVHTNIALGEVIAESVTLEGIGASATFADCRGNLVVKVDAEAVAAIVQPPSATLTLSLETVDGLLLEADDTIRVVDGGSAGN